MGISLIYKVFVVFFDRALIRILYKIRRKCNENSGSDLSTNEHNYVEAVLRVVFAREIRTPP